MSEIEPHWLELTRLGSAYDEELDANAPPTTSDTVKWRHRQRRYTGQPEAAWKPGRAPT